MTSPVVRTLLAAALATVAAPALADSFFMERGAVTASGQQITILRLPIQQSNGTVVLRDVAMRFEIKDGKIVFSNGFPKITPSILPDQEGFVAGTYKLENGDSTEFQLRGPLLGPNGYSRWILSAKNTGGSLEIYPGKINGHPLEGAIKARKITAPYSFGVVTAALANAGFQADGQYAELGDLIALAKVDARTIQFSDYSNSKKGLPDYALTLTRQ